MGEMAAPVAPPAEEQPQPPPLVAALEEPQQLQQPPPMAPMPEATMIIETTELPQAQPPLPEEPQDGAQLPPLEVKVVVDSAPGAVQTKGPGTPTGAKRSREGVEEKDGEKKWSGWPGDNVFRMVVPVQKVGGIIGRKGEFVKKMCEETRSRIKILEGVPGTPERIVSSFTFTFTVSFEVFIQSPSASEGEGQ